MLYDRHIVIVAPLTEQSSADAVLMSILGGTAGNFGTLLRPMGGGPATHCWSVARVTPDQANACAVECANRGWRCERVNDEGGILQPDALPTEMGLERDVPTMETP